MKSARRRTVPFRPTMLKEANVSRFLHWLTGATKVTMGILCLTTTGHAQQISNQQYQTNVTVDVLPFASLEFISSPLLALTIPPAVSTIPARGVSFRVVGNATAIMTAEPSAFIDIPGEGIMGRADLNDGSVGYKLELRFPSTGAPQSPIQGSFLPGYTEGPTEPPRSVDLTITGGQRVGVLHMEASHQWTLDGGLPLPGVYLGDVTLTLTADY